MRVQEYFEQYRKENPKANHRYVMSRLIKQIRKESHLTQLELAKKMKTKQESIARVESGTICPSLDFLQRVAEATGRELKLPTIV